MTADEIHHNVMRAVIDLARTSIAQGERPYAAAVTYRDTIVDQTTDRVFADSDPTSHAEVVVIRQACRHLGVPHLRGHRLYTIGEPCVMCCGAIHWAKLDEVVFAVPQKALQQLSGGTPKPSCRDLLPLGKRTITITGPVLEAEALDVIRRYDFKAKRT